MGEDLELDVNGTKKLIYQLANSYRKVANRNLSTSKLKDSTRF